MEELKSQVAALEKNAAELGNYLKKFYSGDNRETHGKWEDYMKLTELQAKVMDLKLKLAALELQEKA